MTNHIRRREFITLLGGAAAAWPDTTGAQQAKLPVVGYLQGGGGLLSPPQASPFVAAFFEGLNELGYIEGRNVLIEFRGTEQYDKLQALAEEFVRLGVSVIFAATASNAVKAAMAATSTIPIVFANGV